MSLFGKIFKGAKKLVNFGSKVAAIATPQGRALSAVSGVASSLGGAVKRLPTLVKSAGVAAATSYAVDYVTDSNGNQVRRRRRRRKGISGRDLQSFKRVARLIDKFAAPVHRLKKSSFKPKH